MSFDAIGSGPLNYLPCTYSESKLVFRGPKRDLKQPYIAFLGGTHTYGKFVEHPFPDLLEDALGINCCNFGLTNAGVDVLVNDPFLRSAVGPAQVTVVEVLSARNLTNRYFSVHRRRNDRFLKATPLLRATFKGVDFSEINFTKHLLTKLKSADPDAFENVIDELKQSWMARMQMMLAQVPGKKVLLWLSDHAPDQSQDDLGMDPWFVDREMINTLAASADACVEVIAPDVTDTEGMLFSELETPAAEQIYGPTAHAAVRDALAPVLRQLMEGPAA